MKKILLVLSLLCIIPSIGIAQDFKIGAAYGNTRYNSNPIEALEYTNSIVATAEGKEFSFKGFKLSGVLTYKNDFSDPTDVYGFGQKLSYPLGKGEVVEPFVQFTLNVETQYVGHNTVSRTLSYGADLNAGSFYFRPIQVDERRSGGFLSPSTRTFLIGFGFRFKR